MEGLLTESIVVNDPGAMREAVRLGLGVSLIALFDVLPDFERGNLVRLLPDWYADVGVISLYYASRTLISAKTRTFVNFIMNSFESERLRYLRP
jgi:DNA-binding transcriptional LysR family regulator